MIEFVIVMIVICGFQFLQDVYHLGKGGFKKTYTTQVSYGNALIFGILTIWGVCELVIFMRGAIS